MAPPTDSEIIADIPYLTPERRETLDAYLPPAHFRQAGQRVPAVVYIHGGGWTAGDKAAEREIGIANALTAAGYAVFSINYRLNQPAPGVVREEGTRCFEAFAWPQNLEDCKSAVRFVRREAGRFGVDPARIAVMGCSAGGHLAMLLGATQARSDFNATAPDGLYAEESNDVRCVVNFYGPYDLTRGFAFYFPEGVAEQASPRAYLTREMPPLFVTHGTDDDIVPVEQGRDLVAEVRALGVECRYEELPHAPHSYGIVSAHGDLRPAVLDFLAAHC